MKTKETVLSIVGAAAAGAVLGVLFAPDKGTKTRKKISKKTLQKKDEIEQGINNLSNTVVDQYNAVKENGKELFVNGKEKLKDRVNKTAKKV